MRVVNLKLWTVCNYQVAIPWINTSGNTETLGCKFNTDLWWWENKGSLWGASRSYRPQPRFALTWFYFSQELSPSARKRLPWQDPQRLDSPFIWLWFTRPSDGGFWWGGWSLPLCCGLTPFYYKQQTHRSTVSTGDSTFLKNVQQWHDRWSLAGAHDASDMPVRGTATFETTLNRTWLAACNSTCVKIMIFVAFVHGRFCKASWQQHFSSALNLLPTESSNGTINALQFTGTLTSEVAFPSSYWG